jgi:hypothetical protein
MRVDRQLVPWLLGLLLLLLAVAGRSADRPRLMRMLPPAGAVPAWGVYPNTDVYGAGEGLTAIFDGGYELYLRHGVLDAGQQIYRRGTETMTVTVHRHPSAASAEAFYGYWKKISQGQPGYHVLRLRGKAIGNGSFVRVTEGMPAGYAVTGPYLVCAEAGQKDQPGFPTVAAFLAAVRDRASGRVRR